MKKNLKINSDELVGPLGELQELLSEAEDPQFELKNVISVLLNACFGIKEYSHSFVFIIAKLDLDVGQLLPNDESSATSGSKFLSRTVNQLKMRSKTGKVDSVGF